MIGYIIFSDLKGFSKLSEPEIKKYYKEIYDPLYEKMNFLLANAKVLNTWGDAFILIFDEGKHAINWLFEFRNFFRSLDFSKIGIKPIIPRMAAHIGEFDIFKDKFLNRENVLGGNINTTARIEPITKAGEIFVTKQFKDAIESLSEKIDFINFDAMGIIPLAKEFGEAEIYRLREKSEKEHIIDRIIKVNVDEILPDPPGLTEEELNIINFINQAPTIESFHDSVKNSNIKDKTCEFKIEIAEMYKRNGNYTRAIEIINDIENFEMNVDGIIINPYRFNVALQKSKANCLSRLGMYEQSANIVYGLWKLGVRDSDTLSMLAAQYKRMAVYTEGNISLESINIDLLKRAKDLYLEAFRINIDDCYPAINVAYLYKMIGGIETGKGVKLAKYIYDNWEKTLNKNWWIGVILAEAEMLQEDYEKAELAFKDVIDKYKPNIFEGRSVYEQIYIYSIICNKSDELKNILDLIKPKEK